MDCPSSLHENLIMTWMGDGSEDVEEVEEEENVKKRKRDDKKPVGNTTTSHASPKRSSTI